MTQRMEQQTEEAQERLFISQEERAECMEMIQLYHNEFEYRHRLFWDLTCKSLLAVLFLMALPYFIRQGEVGMQLPMAIFPLLSVVLCLLSMWLLHCEARRMRAAGHKRDALKGCLNDAFLPRRVATVHTDDGTSAPRAEIKSISDRLAGVRVTNIVLLLFVLLLVIAAAEAVLLSLNLLF